MKNIVHSVRHLARCGSPALLAALLLTAWLPAARAVVAPEDYPIATSQSDAIKPNIMLLMDGSTSMSFTHMPDEVEGDYNNPRVGYTSFQCNSLYFNPAGGEYYKRPKRSDGTEFPEPAFNAAPRNFYLELSSATPTLRDLNTQFQAFDTTTRRNVSGGSDTPQAAYYWVYTAANGTRPQLAFNSSQCRDATPPAGVTSFAATGGGTWNRVTLSSSSALASQFARWYTYYRTRLNLIKSAVSLAFNASDPVIGPKYRVGLVAMNPYGVNPLTGDVLDSSSVLASKYEPLRTFTNDARALWFSKLFAQEAGGYSPAREGLSRVGRHFANKTDSINSGMNYATGENPFQYACQRNYTIMTTDGYWNTQNETRGPVALDGSTVIGQEDGNFTGPSGNVPWGVYDGSTVGSINRTVQSNQYQIVACSTGQFYMTTVAKKARLSQLRERIDQTSQYENKWQKVTTQFIRTTERFTKSTHNWYTTQTQRMREQWTTTLSQRQLRQYVIEQRGGGYTQRQQWTKSQQKRTQQYQYRDEQFLYRNYTWYASTSRKTFEEYRWTRSTVQNRKTESFDQRKNSQFKLRQLEYRATGYTPYATRSQQWGTQWRYEVYSNETWQPASSAQCSAAGSGSCRTRNVLADTVDYNRTIPSSPQAMTSCTASGPTAGNQYTTTTCESSRRYMDANGNFVSSPTPVPVSSCSPGQSGYTLTECSQTTFTNIPVKSCTGGYAGYVNPTILSTSTVTSCPASGTETQPYTAANITSCSAYPTQSNSSPYTRTECQSTGDADFVNVAAGSCTTASATSPNWIKTECRTRYCAAANCTGAGQATATSFGIAEAAPSCPASTSSDGFHNVSCASNNNAAEPLNALTCSNQTANAGNGWTSKTCNAKVVVTALTPGATCTAGTTQDSASPYVIHQCINSTTGPTAVADGSAQNCPQETASASNNYTDKTCNKVVTNDNTPTPKTPACTNVTPTSSPWLYKECFTTVTTGYTQTACVAVSPSSSNNYKERTCPSNSDETVAVPFGSCTPVAWNGTQTVTCPTTDTGWQNVVSCSPQSPNQNNGYVEILCRDTEVAGNLQNCDATPTHCVTVYEAPLAAVASCQYNPPTGQITASGTDAQGWAYTTYLNTNSNGRRFYCTVRTNGPNPQQALACPSNTGNTGNIDTAYVTNTCQNSAITTDYVDPSTTCTSLGTTASGSSPFTRTRCTNPYYNDGTAVNDRPTATCAAGYDSTLKVTTTCRQASSGPTVVAPGTCDASEVASASNGWTDITCARTTNTGPGPASCTVGSVDGANNRTTDCPTPVPTTTYVASCTGVAQTETAPNYVRVTCGQAAGYPTSARFVQSGTCTAGFNSTTNETTVCTSADTSWRYVAACQNGMGVRPAAAGNGWLRTECEATTSSTGSVDASTGRTGSTWSASAGAFEFVPVGDCTEQIAGAGNNFLGVTCQTTTSAPALQSSCTPVAAGPGNGYQATVCDPIQGQQVQYKGTTTRYSDILSGTQTSYTTVRSTATTLVAPGAWQNLGSCGPTATVPTSITVPSPAQISAQIGSSAAPELANCANWDSTGSCLGAPAFASQGGSTGSLADVAQYFYTTDLKPNGTSTVGRLIPRTPEDPLSDRANYVHMTTFAIGLGVSGTVQYSDDYLTNSTGDFSKILADQTLANGTRNWPVWPDQAISSTTPQVYFDNPKSIDDFWHAATNGRGRYLNGGEVQTVINGLGNMLSKIDGDSGAGAAASTSSPVLSQGDSTIFRATFETSKWTGELTAAQLDPATGDISATTDWAASSLLNAKVGQQCDNRKIFYFKSSAATKLANFTWNTRACDSSMQPTGAASSEFSSESTLTGYFDNTKTALLRQYSQTSYGASITGSPNQKDTAAGANLVNFLRGQRGYEKFVGGDITKLYRERDSVLGTIVGSQPAYVKAPNRDYADNGYYDFKNTSTVKNRPAMVYVGANDGMLHAFRADTGQEEWAFVPTAVMPNMYKLANVDYDHNFYVDGSVVSGDVVVDPTASTPQWRSIIVGGFNKGGRGFYALDVTDPTVSGVKALWEFKGGSTCYDAQAAVGRTEDCGVGLSFGRPIITKLSTGQWVVLVTSGYDSEAYGGNGRSYLYVLNANTGAIIHKIATNTTTVGSGLREIETFVSNVAQNNTTQRVYGGDLLGNIWRFDINGILAPSPATPSEAKYEATLVARAADSNGTAQPITTRPIVGEVRGKTMLIVGTGQLLNQSDLTIASPAPKQSVYAFLDTAIGASTDTINGDVLYPNATGDRSLRGTLKPLKFQTLPKTDPTNPLEPVTRTVVCDTTSAIYSEALCNSEMNWQIDLPDAGERVNIDMGTVGGTLYFTSNVPSTADACSVGGYAYLNYVQIINGLPVPTSSGSTLASVRFSSNALIVGATLTKRTSPTKACTAGTPNCTCTGSVCQKPCEYGVTAVGSNSSTDEGCVPPGSPSSDNRRVSWRELIQRDRGN